MCDNVRSNNSLTRRTEKAHENLFAFALLIMPYVFVFQHINAQSKAANFMAGTEMYIYKDQFAHSFI